VFQRVSAAEEYPTRPILTKRSLEQGTSLRVGHRSLLSYCAHSYRSASDWYPAIKCIRRLKVFWRQQLRSKNSCRSYFVIRTSRRPWTSVP